LPVDSKGRKFRLYARQEMPYRPEDTLDFVEGELQ